MPTRLIRRTADSAEIYVLQPGDRVIPVIGTRERVVMRRGREPYDGLVADPPAAMELLKSGQATVIEED